jgi:hypothetical protein
MSCFVHAGKVKSMDVTAREEIYKIVFFDFPDISSEQYFYRSDNIIWEDSAIS